MSEATAAAGASPPSPVARALRAIDRSWRAPAPAARLSVLRILAGGFALAYVIIRTPHLARFATMDASHFQPVGVVQLLDAPLPTSIAYAIIALTIVAGLAFVLGLGFRVAGPAFAALLLWTTSYGNSFGKILHTENLFVLHVMVLGLTRAADAISIDARRRTARGDDATTDDARYGWPIRLLCVVTVATYFLAGVAKMKLAGVAWFDGESLRNYVAFDNLRKVELGSTYSPIGVALVSQSWLFAPLAWGSMLIELGAPLALVHRRIARVWVAIAWGFHWGIVVLMAVAFVYPMTGLAFAPFFEVERLRRLFERKHKS